MNNNVRGIVEPASGARKDTQGMVDGSFNSVSHGVSIGNSSGGKKIKLDKEE